MSKIEFLSFLFFLPCKVTLSWNSISSQIPSCCVFLYQCVGSFNNDCDNIYDVLRSQFSLFLISYTDEWIKVKQSWKYWFWLSKRLHFFQLNSQRHQIIFASSNFFTFFVPFHSFLCLFCFFSRSFGNLRQANNHTLSRAAMIKRHAYKLRHARIR